MLKILFLGDIFSGLGRKMLRDHLPKLVGQENIDLVFANGENAAGGWGLTCQAAEEIFSYGVSVLTGGNHSFQFKELEAKLAVDRRLVRPANYPEPCPGYGWTIIESPSGIKIGVANLLGRVFLNCGVNSPFTVAEQIIKEMKDAGAQITIIDFHAEATSEKRALAWHLLGKISALVGTHTHVQTADEEIMCGETAYITDLGMCGPHASVIGMRNKEVLDSYLSGRNFRFEASKHGGRLQGAIIEFNEKFVPIAIKRVNIENNK